MSVDDAPQRALFWALEQTLPDVAAGSAQGPVLFLGARAGAWLQEGARHWRCEQSFRPFAEALNAQGIEAVARIDERGFGLTLILPPRSREAARIALARAVDASAEGGWILAAAGNDEGGRSLATDMSALLPQARVLSKHKCRIVVAQRDGSLQHELLQTWLAQDALQWIESAGEGFWSRPGLFAWDRIDPASALLRTQLPDDLCGRVADFGAGWGCLSQYVARHCPGVTALDVFEADARALDAAQRNLEAACAGRALPFKLHWHDVLAGVPGTFDAVLMNPPFHITRADQPELGRGFIQRAAEALQDEGTLWLVANRHLPYENTLQTHFSQVQELAQAEGFKVFRASGVRR